MVRKYFCKDIVRLHEKQLMILVYLASLREWELVSQTKIAEQWDIPITSLNYHFTKLKKVGLLDKKYQLTEKGKMLLRHFKHWDKSFDRKFRAHNVQVTFNIVKPPHDFEKLRTTIMKPFSNGRYHGGMVEVLECTVMFYSKKKAVVKLPPIYGDTSDEIAAAILDFSGQLKEALEQEFPGLKIDGYKHGRYFSMHVALVNSIIAKQFILENNRNFSTEKIVIDKSHGCYELEAVNAKTALEDIEVLVRYEDIVKENDRLKTEITKLESLLEKFRKK